MVRTVYYGEAEAEFYNGKAVIAEDDGKKYIVQNFNGKSYATMKSKNNDVHKIGLTFYVADTISEALTFMTETPKGNG